MAVENNIDLFANIPRELTVDILSRLPVRSIIKAKFARKEFRDIIESPDFHLSEPQTHLLVIPNTTTSTSWHAKFLKLKDDKIYPNMVAIDLVVPGYKPLLLNSVNSLILLSEYHDDLPLHHISICNPITREYVTLPNPPPPEYHYSRNSNFGLGVSKRTGQYKVVRIVQLQSNEYECQVYTLGTGKWRTIMVGAPPVKSKVVCTFVGGNLHWLIWSEDVEEKEAHVSRFDLDTEVFTTLSVPPRCHESISHRSLYAFDDCLCLCDDSWSTLDGQIVIWLMRDDKSWTKDFSIYKTSYYRRFFGYLTPFKLLENGDLIMWDRTKACVFFYSSKTKYIKDYTNFFDPSFDLQSIAHLYTPSFLPLKTSLLEEDVRSF